MLNGFSGEGQRFPFEMNKIFKRMEKKENPEALKIITEAAKLKDER